MTFSRRQSALISSCVMEECSKLIMQSMNFGSLYIGQWLPLDLQAFPEPTNMRLRRGVNSSTAE